MMYQLAASSAPAAPLTVPAQLEPSASASDKMLCTTQRASRDPVGRAVQPMNMLRSPCRSSLRQAWRVWRARRGAFLLLVRWLLLLE